MSTWFISRHPGAVEWARRQAMQVDHWRAHVDIAAVRPGDTVAGTLPIQLAAQVCALGATYLHLSLDLPAHWRGRELSVEELQQAGARLDAFLVQAQHDGVAAHGPSLSVQAAVAASPP
jgi:CRISPR-associated protein Csx16